MAGSKRIGAGRHPGKIAAMPDFMSQILGPPPATLAASKLRGFAFALILVAITTLVVGVLFALLHVDRIVGVFIIPVLIASIRWGLLPGVLAAFASVALIIALFTPPPPHLAGPILGAVGPARGLRCRCGRGEPPRRLAQAACRNRGARDQRDAPARGDRPAARGADRLGLARAAHAAGLDPRRHHGAVQLAGARAEPQLQGLASVVRDRDGTAQQRHPEPARRNAHQQRGSAAAFRVGRGRRHRQRGAGTPRARGLPGTPSRSISRPNCRWSMSTRSWSSRRSGNCSTMRPNIRPRVRRSRSRRRAATARSW